MASIGSAITDWKQSLATRLTTIESIKYNRNESQLSEYNNNCIELNAILVNKTKRLVNVWVESDSNERQSSVQQIIISQ